MTNINPLIFIVSLMFFFTACVQKDYSYIHNIEDNDHLLTILKSDKDRHARAHAAKTLGDLKKGFAEMPLIETAMNDSSYDVRKSAAIALKKTNSLKAVNHFNNAFEKSDPEVRYRAALALYWMDHKVPFWIVSLKSNNRSTRLDAAYSLSNVQDPRSVAPLIEALQSEEIGVAGYSARALGKQQDPRAVEPLIRSINENHFALADAAWALGELRASSAVEPLIHILETGSSFHRKYNKRFHVLSRPMRQIIEALGKIGDKRAFMPVLDSISRYEEAGDALININHPETAAYIRIYLKYSNTEDTGIKEISAAKIISRINDPEGNELLKKHIINGDRKIAAAAFPFYIKLGMAGTEDVLIDALKLYGTKDMAESFINSGNLKLSNAGRSWASKHGYKIMYASPNNHNVKWGEEH